MKDLTPLKIIDTNKDDINNFVNITDKAIFSEKLNEKVNLIEQLLGHIKQLLVRVDNILSKEKLTTISSSIDNINKTFLMLKNSTTNNTLNVLDSLYQEISKIYKSLKVDAINVINNTNIT